MQTTACPICHIAAATEDVTEFDPDQPGRACNWCALDLAEDPIPARTPVATLSVRIA